MNPNAPKTSTPVEAGKVGVFYFPGTNLIAYKMAFPKAGNIVTALSVIVADDDAALDLAIAKAGLTERK
jgi:hypothetical protein